MYVLARINYPRPILGMGSDAPLDGSDSVAYVAEPLNVVQRNRPLGDTVEDALNRGAGIRADQILSMMPGTTYYPSHGGLLEDVRSVFMQIEPLFINVPLGNVSGFSSSGRVTAIEARELLRAAQVGGLPDARLEINVHDLLLNLQQDPGPWIGADIDHQPSLSVEAASLDEILARFRRRFDRVKQGTDFLGVETFAFTEHAADGSAVATRNLEFVARIALATNAFALLAHDEFGRVVLGVDEDDLPAAQVFNGNSNLAVTPAWRVLRALKDVRSDVEFVRAKLNDDYGVQVLSSAGMELGGAYRPSASLTPVYPFAVQAAASAPSETPRSLDRPFGDARTYCSQIAFGAISPPNVARSEAGVAIALP